MNTLRCTQLMTTAKVFLGSVLILLFFPRKLHERYEKLSGSIYDTINDYIAFPYFYYQWTYTCIGTRLFYYYEYYYGLKSICDTDIDFTLVQKKYIRSHWRTPTYPSSLLWKIFQLSIWFHFNRCRYSDFLWESLLILSRITLFWYSIFVNNFFFFEWSINVPTALVSTKMSNFLSIFFLSFCRLTQLFFGSEFIIFMYTDNPYIYSILKLLKSV